MTTFSYRVSVVENFGVYESELEESQWGPYVHILDLEVPFEKLEPKNIVIDSFVPQDVEIYDEWMSFDVYEDGDEPNSYCRYNYYVTPIEY